MKTAIARTDNSILGRWWWTVDHPLLGALSVLFIVGTVLNFSATPAIAAHLKLDTYFLVRHQIVFMILSALVMIGVSLQTPKTIRLISLAMTAAMLVCLVLVLIHGTQIKGASRWIRVFGISLQPSEFAKPAFAVVAAWLISLGKSNPHVKGTLWTAGLYLVLVGLLIKQPDFGMVLTVSVIFGIELFLSGLPMSWISALILAGGIGATSAYFLLPHVQARIDRFINPEAGDTFQVRTAFEAIRNGGLFGMGPGEGTVKNILPDAHTDFVLAVAAEEFGLFVTLLIVLLFAFIVYRGFLLILTKDKNLFTLLAVSGLLAQFGMQALVNMASTLSLIPTKGMTLPFVSYGGSSLLSLGFAMGMVLGLTRSTNTGKDTQ